MGYSRIPYSFAFWKEESCCLSWSSLSSFSSFSFSKSSWLKINSWTRSVFLGVKSWGLLDRLLDFIFGFVIVPKIGFW